MKWSLIRKISDIRQVLSTKIEMKRETLKEIMQSSKNIPINDIKVHEVLDGMKGMRTMLCETSKVGAEGIIFRGYPLNELIYQLPGSHKQPCAESMLWLLLTGDVPTYPETQSLIDEFSANAELPKHIEELLFNLPKEMHPMTQLSIAILSLNEYSQFSKFSGPKTELWRPMLEDCLFLIAKLPRIAGIIYRSTFKDGKICNPGKFDLAKNFAMMMGSNDENFFEALRLFLFIHSDHEGGNVSTHATRLVGSALSNAFLAYSSGVNGLAGPIHGQGMQFCLMWLVNLWQILGDNIDELSVEVYVKSYLKTHDKIPGFGHPVLKSTDTRFLAQLEFAERYLKEEPLCQLIKICYKIVPDILKEHGKVNAFPNMYLHSGGILYHYGLRMYEFYNVLFAVSRSIGALSNLVWDRALLLDIERPISVTIEELEDLKDN